MLQVRCPKWLLGNLSFSDLLLPLVQEFFPSAFLVLQLDGRLLEAWRSMRGVLALSKPGRHSDLRVPRKQPRRLSTDDWLKKLQYIYTMEYYSVIKMNVFESILLRWTTQSRLQSEISHKEKYKCCILTQTYGILRDGTDEFIFRTAMENQTLRTELWT